MARADIKRFAYRAGMAWFRFSFRRPEVVDECGSGSGRLNPACAALCTQICFLHFRIAEQILCATIHNHIAGIHHIAAVGGLQGEIGVLFDHSGNYFSSFMFLVAMIVFAATTLLLLRGGGPSLVVLR